MSTHGEASINAHTPAVYFPFLFLLFSFFWKCLNSPVTPSQGLNQVRAQQKSDPTLTRIKLTESLNQQKYSFLPGEPGALLLFPSRWLLLCSVSTTGCLGKKGPRPFFALQNIMQKYYRGWLSCSLQSLISIARYVCLWVWAGGVCATKLSQKTACRTQLWLPGFKAGHHLSFSSR